MASHIQRFLHDDVVQLRSKPQQIGVIARTATDEPEDEEEDFEEEVPIGSALVAWLKSADNKMESEDVLELVDRSFMHGDIVVRVGDPVGGQSGTVTNVRVAVDLKYLQSGQKRRRVPSEKLGHIRQFRPGHYVTHGFWLGRVESVSDDVVVQFDDGSQVKIQNATPDTLTPLDEAFDEQTPFFPTQRVRASSARVLQQGRWLKGSYRNRLEGMVTSVQVSEVFIEWITAANGQDDSDPPPEACEPAVLQPMSVFCNTWWQLGDHTVTDPESLKEYADQSKKKTKEHPHDGDSDGCEAPGGSSSGPVAGLRRVMAAVAGVSRRRQGRQAPPPARKRKQAAKKNSPAAQCAQVTRVYTTVDVQWQDGSSESGIESTRLLPAAHLQAHDFWPDEFVLEKGEDADEQRELAAAIALSAAEAAGPEAEGASGEATAPAPPSPAPASPASPAPAAATDENGEPNEPQLSREESVVESRKRTAALKRRAGVVLSVNVADRTAVVRWLRTNSDGTITVDPTVKEETVSVYDIVEHPDYAYRLGDVVVRLEPVPIPADEQDSDSSDESDEEGGAETSGAAGAEESGEEGTGSSGESGSGDGEAGEGRHPHTCHHLDPALQSRWVGELLCMHGGLLHVTWSDNTSSWVGPSEVYVVGDDDEFEDEENEDEENDDDDDDDDDDDEEDGGEGDSDGEQGEGEGGADAENEEADDGDEDGWEVASNEDPSHYDGHAAGGAARGGAGGAGKGNRREAGAGGRRAGRSGRLPNAPPPPHAHMLSSLPPQLAEAIQGALRRAGQAGSPIAIGEVAGGTDPSSNSRMAVVLVGNLVDGLQAIKLQDAARPAEGSAPGPVLSPEAAATIEGLLRTARSGAVATNVPPELASALEAALRESAAAQGQTPPGSPGGALRGFLQRSWDWARSQFGAPSVPPQQAEEDDERQRRRKKRRAAGPSTAAGGGGGGGGGGSDSDKDEDEDEEVDVVGEGPDAGPDSAPGEAATGEDLARFAVLPAVPGRHPDAAAARRDPHSARAFTARVQREWRALRSALPDGIYVRAYDDNMALLSVLVVGPQGTPYADAVFVIDVTLPADYPQSPPKLTYWSVGERINPNLYTNGKVCLSLLGTWDGEGREQWDPATSTLLQVLVSVQGLVLNEHPYFNEAGYEAQLGTEEGAANSRSYNENAFLIALRSILPHLRSPPAPFAALIRSHFASRRGPIVERCRALLEPAAAPSPSVVPPFAHAPSGGFRASLARLLPRIEAALASVTPPAPAPALSSSSSAEAHPCAEGPPAPASE